MASALHWLVEIDARNGMTETTLRVSSNGYTTKPSDSPANTHYTQVVSNPGSFRRDLFTTGRTRGPSEIDYGEIVLNNAKGELDAWKGYDIVGREVRVYSIASNDVALSTRTLRIRGSVEKIITPRALTEWTFQIRGRRLDLNRPLLTTLYAGTTSGVDETAEGGSDLKDQVKPRVFGKVYNARPKLVNQNFQLFQISVAAINAVAVYDGGVPLTLESDVSTLSALCSGEIPGGEYRSALNLGIVRVRSQSSMITCDATEGATAADRYPGAVAERLLLAHGIDAADIDDTTFDALNSAASYEVGIYIDDTKTAMTAAREIVQSVGGWVSPNSAGVYEAGRVVTPTSPTATINANKFIANDINLELNPDSEGIPIWRVVVRYSRNYQVQAGSNVYSCVSESRKDFLIREYRQAVAEDSAVLTNFPLAGELIVDTLLTDATDAAAEATRLLALYKVNRDLLNPVPVKLADEADYPVGGMVSIVNDRLGYSGGKTATIIGRGHRLSDELVDLVVWG